jgi:transcriptional regulator with XRE-family HTH domain
MPEDPIIKRIRLIIKEHGGQNKLAKIINVDQGFISRVANGKYEVTMHLIRPLVNMGYAPEWLLLGTGEKKKEKDGKKLITEIASLMDEIELMDKRLKLQEERFKYLDKEILAMKEQQNNHSRK